MEIWNYSSGDWSLLHSIDLSRHLEGDSLLGPQIIRAIGYFGDCGPMEKMILATSNGKVITYDLLSRTLDTILAIPETPFYKTDEQYAPRFSLFKESLAPVHKTNVEMALSSASPLAKVIKEILLRLPGDFATQFKLVSKQWLSLIESGSFIRSYHAHNNMDREPKVMLVGKGPGGLGFSFAPSKKLLRDCPSQGAWLDTKVVCSKPCHGMNLISTETEDYLYNPSTEDHVFAVGNKNAGLGFNMLKQEHVVVQIFYHVKDFESQQYFLTCSVTGLTSIQHNLEPHLPINSMPPAYVAGVLYWMSEPRLMQIHKRVIVSFDVTKMMFDLVPCPSPIAMWSDTSPCQAFVVELRECYVRSLQILSQKN
uniref:F-box domain-containing protein n=1 Tax=Aegilops tauschii TaxID=37682 RepID=N1QU53_AEGTA